MICNHTNVHNYVGFHNCKDCGNLIRHPQKGDSKRVYVKMGLTFSQYNNKSQNLARMKNKLKIVDHLNKKALIDNDNNVLCMGIYEQLENIINVFNLLRTAKGIILQGENAEDGEIDWFKNEVKLLPFNDLFKFKTEK